MLCCLADWLTVFRRKWAAMMDDKTKRERRRRGKEKKDKRRNRQKEKERGEMGEKKGHCFWNYECFELGNHL